MNWRTHAITFFVFIFAFGSLKLVWDHPKIILYIILGIIGIIAYGALYLIVKTKMENDGKK
jgi:ABC-type uncharacterized transport system permease subunit